MPVNELEVHPYLDYYKGFGQISNDYYRGIIIGSFPIYAITNTVNQQNELVEERLVKEAAHMRFFYGSKKSDLWKYVGLALNGTDPRKKDEEFLDSEQAAINSAKLLYANQLLMTDVLYRTNRKLKSADDKDLMLMSNSDWVKQKLSLNKQLVLLLRENVGITDIYFTSTSVSTKGPLYWFKEIFSQKFQSGVPFYAGKRSWSVLATVDFGDDDIREYNLFFLPTPKARGLHWASNRTYMFEKYVASQFPDFYNEINLIPKSRFTSAQKQRLSNLRVKMLVDAYKQAICYSNIKFDGSNLLTEK